MLRGSSELPLHERGFGAGAVRVGAGGRRIESLEQDIRLHREGLPDDRAAQVDGPVARDHDQIADGGVQRRRREQDQTAQRIPLGHELSDDRPHRVADEHGWLGHSVMVCMTSCT